MRHITAFVVLSATGCQEVPLPYNDEAVVLPEGHEEAYTIAKSEWERRFGFGPLDGPPVTWYSGDCLEYGDDAPAVGCLLGVYWERPFEEAIHLVWEHEPSQSALAHELLHWAFDVSCGSPDSDHSSPEWDGELQEVEDIMARAGL